MACVCTCTSQLPQHPQDVVITAHPYSVQTNDSDRLKLTRAQGSTKVEGIGANEVSGVLTVPLASPPSTVRNLRWIRIEGLSSNALLRGFRLQFGQQDVYSTSEAPGMHAGPIDINQAIDHIRHNGRHISLEIDVTLAADRILEIHSVSLGFR